MQIKDSREDSGRFSGVFSSSGSPRRISRSSSRLSIQDDTDDSFLPFAVDDVDAPDSRPGYV
jgi:autophagy-related protein 13